MDYEINKIRNILNVGPRKTIALKTILLTAVMIMGILSLIWAFEIRTEIDNLGIDDLSLLDPETRQQVQSRIVDFGIEFIFGMVMIPLGGLTLLSLYLNHKYPKINHNRERIVTHFQTQFGFGLLVIAILISFSIQSMNDNRVEWIYIWSILSVIGVVSLVIYRAKMLHEIFDSNHDIL